MKKLLILITFLMLSAVFSYADNVRVGTLGYPVISFNDTSILDLFPSRIQDMGGSSVFFSLDSALNAVPGVILNTGKLMGLEYLFNAPTRNRPAALTANALYTLSGGSLPARLASPLYLVYGADLGFIKAGVKWQWANAAGSYTERDTANNLITTSAVVDYSLHTITPGITLKLGDKAALDVSVPLNWQLVNNRSETALDTNSVTAPAFESLGASAAFSLELSPTLTVALRADYRRVDSSYLAGSSLGTSTELQAYGDYMGMMLGAKLSLYSSFDIYLNIMGSYSNGTSLTIVNGVAGATARTVVWRLPDSASAGGELKLDAWRFRMGLVNIFTATQTITTPGTENVLTLNANTFSFVTGVGYEKDGWIVNAQVNTRLFTDTLYMFSGIAISPVAAVSVTYLFNGK